MEYDSARRHARANARGAPPEYAETFLGKRVDYENLLSRAACGLFECEPDGTLLYANQAYAELTGLPIAELVGKRTFLSLLAVDRTSTGMAGPQAWRNALSADRHFEQECVYRRHGRQLRTVLQAISPLGQADDRRYVGVTMDVTRRASETRNAWYAAHYDTVTRLPNFFLLEERLSLLLRRRPVAVVSVAVDDIGALPRAAGLPEWEGALQVLAARLRAFGGDDGIVAHLGAGEFFVALGAGQPAGETAGQVLKRLCEPLRVAGHLTYARVSAGLYEHTGGGDTACAHDLIRRAHLALSHAREAGGCALRRFTDRMETELTDRWSLASDLAGAVADNGLFLEYQPEMDLRDGRLVVAEALVRWRHPRRGRVSPADFIPVAEAAGLIGALGAWVMEQACRFGRALQTRYGDAPRIAVNVSPLQFREADLADAVSAVLERTGLDPARLELEITEGVLLEAGAAVAGTLDRLHDMGVRLVLDDFGTGYSSLGYLARHPVDRLKIDRSFVRRLPHDPRSRAIVTAIIGMARALGMEVTAEGIETAEQADFLRELGCPLGQGFGLYRPLAAQGLENLLTPRFAA